MLKTKILVTGGAGFVGSQLIKKLAQNPNNTLYCLDNYFTGKRENHIPGVIYIEGDTSHIDELIPNGEDIDVVYHFGEYSRVFTSFEDSNLAWKYNILGTYKVLEFCRRNKCKIIYSASSTKFGDAGENIFKSPYALYKAHNTNLISCYTKWFDVKSVICYFYNVYGPGQITTGKYATVIGIFETQFINNEPLTVVSPGTQKRTFTHIEDVISALILLQHTSGDEYCIGTAEEHRIIDVAKMFTDNISYLNVRPGERKTTSINLAKMHALGWSPKHSLEDYIHNIKGVIS